MAAARERADNVSGARERRKREVLQQSGMLREKTCGKPYFQLLKKKMYHHIVLIPTCLQFVEMLAGISNSKINSYVTHLRAACCLNCQQR